MTGTKRLLTLLGLAVAVLVGSSIPAAATFSDSTAVPTMSIATRTVVAPGAVTGRLTCGSPNSTMSLTWNASGTPRVNGYRVTVHFSDGYEQVENLPATATSWSKSISTYNVTNWSIQYSVTTLTDYGWTKQSGRTGAAKC